jgi:hypothetical protein
MGRWTVHTSDVKAIPAFLPHSCHEGHEGNTVSRFTYQLSDPESTCRNYLEVDDHTGFFTKEEECSYRKCPAKRLLHSEAANYMKEGEFKDSVHPHRIFCQ